jgi:8-oxo-dGTP diphosphatase
MTRRTQAEPASAADFAPLTTERLSLRPLRPQDADAVHRLVNDWSIARNLESVPFPYAREQADKWIADTERELAAARAYHLAVVETGGDRLIGVVGLRLDPKRARTATLGYWVGREWWGKGFATEAAGRLARWALANLALDDIFAAVAVDNPASVAVLQRLGFRQIGEATHRFLARSSDQRVVCFAAGRDELFGKPEAAAVPDAAGGKPLVLVAACALIDIDTRVLLARRPEGKKMAGLWEFPGGKLDAGETPEVALIRELHEELGIDVTEACLAPFAFASHAYPHFHLLMPLFLCRRWKGIPTGREGQELTWVRPQRLGDYPMPPADKPLIPLLRDFL